MTTAEMIALLKQRTKIQDPTKLLLELREGYRWAVNKVFKSADGPQMLMTVGEEITLNADTRDYNLEANLAAGNNLLGFQQLWVKLPDGTNFSLMYPRDIEDPDFISQDSATAADPLIAQGHPIFFAVLNYGSVRFAPALPSGSVLRVDYARVGPVPDPTTNPTQENGTDIPGLFHSACVAKATAHLFNTLDDDREGGWETRAESFLNDAIFAAGKAARTQRPVKTQPFRRTRYRRGL